MQDVILVQVDRDIELVDRGRGLVQMFRSCIFRTNLRLLPDSLPCAIRECWSNPPYRQSIIPVQEGTQYYVANHSCCGYAKCKLEIVIILDS